MLRSTRVSCNEGQVDLVFLHGGKCDLGLLSFFLDALERVRLLGKIDAAVLLEFTDDPIDQDVIPVITAEVGIAVRRLHFEDAVADFEHGNIESAATQVIDGDLFVLLLIKAVGERGRGRFVDDAENFEARDLAGIFGGIALRVVEVRRHRNHGLRDLFAEFRFGVGLEFRENHRGNFRRRECLLLSIYLHLDVRVAIRGLHDFVGHAMLFLVNFVELAAHEPLD